MSDNAVRVEMPLEDPRYPELVRQLPEPPAMLYVRGDADALSRPCLSVIGARVATPYGIAAAEMAARIAAESGIVVVSGGARGCDSAAGAAALDAGGTHIAVLGCGADVVYPKSSGPLLQRTLESGGAIVSLDPWGMEPRRWAFPRRNRVIAALSRALVVTEAGMPSGTFSTAETANALGHEVLAIPGSIFSKQSRGSNYLISVGATCIADEDELEMAISRIYGVLRFSRPDAPGISDVSVEEQRVLDALAASPLRMEEVCRMLGIGIQPALQMLSGMAVRGLVERLLDGRYALTKLALHARTPLGHNVGSRSTDSRKGAVHVL